MSALPDVADLPVPLNEPYGDELMSISGELSLASTLDSDLELLPSLVPANLDLLGSGAVLGTQVVPGPGAATPAPMATLPGAAAPALPGLGRPLLVPLGPPRPAGGGFGGGTAPPGPGAAAGMYSSPLALTEVSVKVGAAQLSQPASQPAL